MIRKKGRGKKERTESLEILSRLVPCDAVTFHSLPIQCARAFSGKDGSLGKRPQQSITNALQVLARRNAITGANVIPIRCVIDPIRKT